MTTRHFVLGTAGHVDHGKTALVKALTGTDTDRLPEERARGISIELGFALWPLGDGASASVVDVPGHERFVQTMVAGAAGIDCVLLVVAADDGVMPQTREHLAICELLGVPRGVVAVTKADLADADMLQLVVDDVRDAVRGTFLEGAAVVPCSAKEGRGLEELARAVLAASQGAVAGTGTRAALPAFLPIDRVFSKAGAGTIVTGTLVRGVLREGDAIDALPTAHGAVAQLAIRSLQVHGAKAALAHAPSRVAVNLRGDDEGALRRGAVLAAAGWQTPTRHLVARVELARGAAPLGKKTEVIVHLGTSHRVADLTLAAPELAAGTPAIGRLALRGSIAAFAGQRFVLRRPDLADHRTVAGGTIVDPHPARRRGPSGLAAHDPPRARLLAFVTEAREAGVTRARLAPRMPPEEPLDPLLASLVTERAVARIDDDRYVARAHLDAAKAELTAALRAFHAERPEKTGMSPAELVTRRPPRGRALVPVALAELERDGVVVTDRDVVRLKNHDPRASHAASDVLARFTEAGLAPASDEQVRAAVGVDPRVFRDALAELKREGKLRMLSGGLHFATARLQELAQLVVGWFATHATLVPNDLKALSGGLTRKHAIPLLEWLDAEGVTKRQGEARVAGPRAKR